MEVAGATVGGIDVLVGPPGVTVGGSGVLVSRCRSSGGSVGGGATVGGATVGGTGGAGSGVLFESLSLCLGTLVGCAAGGSGALVGGTGGAGSGGIAVDPSGGANGFTLSLTGIEVEVGVAVRRTFAGTETGLTHWTASK